MPKEITYGELSSFLLLPNGDEIPEADFDPLKKEGTEYEEGKWRRRGVQVSWLKDRHVEIGVASFDPSREMPSDGVFITMTREGLNRHIRALQRAGRAAFGQDAW